MARVFAPLALAVSFVVVAACSTTEATPSPEKTGAIARFRFTEGQVPDFLDVPFPSDVYRTPPGTIMDPIPALERVLRKSSGYIAHDIARANGFSRIALSHFHIDDLATGLAAPLDATTLPRGEVACQAATSSVFLLDLEATEADARVLCRTRIHHDGPRGEAQQNLAVGPARGILLKEGHSYATVITSRVHTKDGAPILASDGLARARKSTSREGVIVANALTKAEALLASALAPDHATIVAIAPYTTHTQAAEFYELRETMQKQPAPVLRWDAASVAPMGAVRFAKLEDGVLPTGFTASLDDYLGVVAPEHKLPSGIDDPDVNLRTRAHDHIRAIATAAFEAPSFLKGIVGADSNQYRTMDFSTFTRDASGQLMMTGNERIWATFVLPDSPMPATGYPAIFFGHGLGGSRHIFLDLANQFAAHGWMTIMTDAIAHGARSRSERFRRDVKTQWEGNPGATYKGPDGLADPIAGSYQDATDMFGGLLNLGALRDQFRQGAIDRSSLVRALENADLTPLSPTGEPIKVDLDKLGYSGSSLGGIDGALFAAIEPRVRNFILAVPGGGLLTELGARSPEISQLLGGAMAFYYDVIGQFVHESNPINTLLQTTVEACDPILFAPHLVKEPHVLFGVPMTRRNVLQIEIPFDTTVPNESNEAFARAAGFGLAMPNLGSYADVLDIKHIENNPWRTPFPSIAPDAIGIHDTPVAGATGVVVQVSPSHHGIELTASTALRNFRIPYGDFESNEPFVPLYKDARVKVRNPYLQMQEMVFRFLEDGFAGRVPVVTGIPPVRRDADDDGVDDDVDPDPNSAEIK